MRNVLYELSDNRVGIYGNTGRHNDPSMVSATYVSLALNRISDRFKDIFFRQRGLTTAESKISALKHVADDFSAGEQIVVADDNPADLLPMAKHFPKVRFFLISDLTTDRLLRGINLEEEFPNVKVKSTLRAALLE